MTEQQTRVLSCLLEGMSGKEIGRALGITESTVKVHLQGVYKTAGSNRLPDLVKLALACRALWADHPLVRAFEGQVVTETRSVRLGIAQSKGA